VKKILILTANPQDTDRLRLDQEIREIQAALERSRDRDEFEIVTQVATRPEDLRRSLLTHNPYIVHFSGHGSGAAGIALEKNDGTTQLVSTTALAKLFGAFKGIQCVVLNACYSDVQAIAIHQQIETVIGMSQAIGALLRRYRKGRAAVEFAVGVYDALFAGRSVVDAFESVVFDG
jgi:CHAT domain